MAQPHVSNDVPRVAENPLDPSDEVESRIRSRAYHLWESEGRPDGRDLEYWERARELEGMYDSNGAGLLPVDNTLLPEHAALQANLGEFPDRFTDQGDRLPTPVAETTRNLHP